jgi:hypothetical protein
MKHLALACLTWCLSSCVHTAIAPVCTPEGAQAVIRIPGLRYGQRPTPSDLQKVSQTVEKKLDIPGANTRQQKDTGLTKVREIVIFGDAETKKGERFVGYMPTIVMQSTLPAEQVDRAAGVLAAGFYRSALKSYKVFPVTDLAQKPTSKP